MNGTGANNENALCRNENDGVEAKQPSRQEQLIDELIFKQDLNEVHTLIDFVSGRPDRSLRELSIPNPDDPSKVLGSGEIMKAIAEMRYPPTGTRAANARNAFILLLAREELSRLAAPATSRSIAYTRMFIDAEGFSWLGRSRRREIDNESRLDLAEQTYPQLRGHAHKFRRWRDGLALFSLLWLLVTGLAYWDAGLGRAALERLDQDWKTIVAKLKDNPGLIRCPASPDAFVAAGSPSEEVIQKEFACREYNYLKVVGKTAGEQVNDVFHCARMGPASRFVHVWCWHWLLSGTTVEPEKTGGDGSKASDPGETLAGASSGAAMTSSMVTDVSPYARANVAYWQTATAILSVFTAYILPMMFSLLGTLIGAFRAILNRIGANELTPRDLVRMQIGIPTGLVAGIAVGLFLSPSTIPMQGAGAISGQLTLTASGLGFLAGYASYSFFGFLDNLIRTAFPSLPVPNPSTTPRPVPRGEHTTS